MMATFQDADKARRQGADLCEKSRISECEFPLYLESLANLYRQIANDHNLPTGRDHETARERSEGFQRLPPQTPLSPEAEALLENLLALINEHQ